MEAATPLMGGWEWPLSKPEKQERVVRPLRLMDFRHSCHASCIFAVYSLNTVDVAKINGTKTSLDQALEFQAFVQISL